MKYLTLKKKNKKKLCIIKFIYRESGSFYDLLKLAKPEKWIITIGVIAAAIAGIADPFFSFIFAKLSGIFYEEDADEMRDKLSMWAWILVGYGALVLITTVVRSITFDVGTEKLTIRVREMMYYIF